MIHKYWARKPHNIVRNYIETYTNPGDVVLDPFCGSGVTVAEAILCGRRVIGVDINPVATQLTRTTVEPLDLDRYHNAAKKILETGRAWARDLYALECPVCGRSSEATHVIWTTRAEASHEVDLIRGTCATCGEYQLTATSEPGPCRAETRRRGELASQVEDRLAADQLWAPDAVFRYPSGEKFLQLRHDLRERPRLRELFTPRNLLVLAFLFHHIRALPDATLPARRVKEALLTTFTSALGQASKMVWVIRKRKGKVLEKPQVGSWTHHFFWNPSEYFEVNAVNCFEHRVRKMLKGKRDSNARLAELSLPAGAPVVALGIEPGPTPGQVFTGPVSTFARHVQARPELAGSVDFIFTDPPYGDSIQYLELSAFFNAWLEPARPLTNEAEITINRNQEKGLAEYSAPLEQAFRCCHFLLKAAGFMVVTFHNTEFEYRNALIQSALAAGFVLDHVLFQHPPRRSLKSYLHPKKSIPGDYYLRFQKRDGKIGTWRQQDEISHAEQVARVKEAILHLLGRRGEPTSFPCLMNILDAQLAREDLLHHITTKAFQEALYDSPGLTFTGDDMIWVRDPEDLAMVPVPLSERLAREIDHFFESRERPQKKPIPKPLLHELLHHLYLQFHGVEFPDEFVVKRILRDKGWY